MAKKSRKKIEVFHYDCSLTGESFKTNKKATNPEELVSVRAFYELNPDLDDRPEKIKVLSNMQEEERLEENELQEALKEEEKAKEKKDK